MEVQKDFREFVELLNEHEVEYIIVGGFALAFHGVPRFTGRKKDLADLESLGEE